MVEGRETTQRRVSKRRLPTPRMQVVELLTTRELSGTSDPKEGSIWRGHEEGGRGLAHCDKQHPAHTQTHGESDSYWH